MALFGYLIALFCSLITFSVNSWQQLANVGQLWNESYCWYSVARILLASQPASSQSNKTIYLSCPQAELLCSGSGIQFEALGFCFLRNAWIMFLYYLKFLWKLKNLLHLNGLLSFSGVGRGMVFPGRVTRFTSPAFAIHPILTKHPDSSPFAWLRALESWNISSSHRHRSRSWSNSLDARFCMALYGWLAVVQQPSSLVERRPGFICDRPVRDFLDTY